MKHSWIPLILLCAACSTTSTPATSVARDRGPACCPPGCCDDDPDCCATASESVDVPAPANTCCVAATDCCRAESVRSR
jgi:hypothetical protein